MTQKFKTVPNKMTFTTRFNGDSVYLAERISDNNHRCTNYQTTNKDHSDYSTEKVLSHLNSGAWKIKDVLEAETSATIPGRDGLGKTIQFGLNDIMDFMRVRLADGMHIVYTNARSSLLSKYVTNGFSHKKLVLSEVLEVYSQPEGKDVLLVNAAGRLRFKPTDLVALAEAKAKVEAAAETLAAAKAALEAV